MATNLLRRTLNKLGVVTGAAAVLIVCGVFSFGAAKVFPVWDDGWLWLLLEEQGLGAIVPSHPERPVTVWLWSLLAPSTDAFWRNAWLAQVVLWPVLAVLSWRLWLRVEPSRRRWGGTVALCVVLPTVTHVQMLTANVALASLLSVILGYAAVVAAFEAIHCRSGWSLIWACLGAAALIAGVLHQEYAVAVAAVGTVLLWHESVVSVARRRRAFIAGALMAVIALTSYLAYLAIGDFGPGSRPQLNPERFLTLDPAIHGLKATLPQALWQGLVGGWWNALLRVLRSAHVVAAVVFGTSITVLALVRVCWRARDGTSRPRPAILTIAALLIGTVAGLAPSIIAGQVPWDPTNGVDSRFGLPAVVPLAMLLVSLVTSIEVTAVRGVLAAIFLFVPLAATWADVASGVEEAKRLTRYGRCLQSVVELSEDTTVAIVPSTVRPLGPARQWELTARLARAMPKSGLSHRMWAHREGGGPSLGSSDTAFDVYKSRERCSRRRVVRAAVRNLSRQDALARVVRLDETVDGGVRIESYCLNRRGGVAFSGQCDASNGGAGE